jgi:hypothetical protein
VSCPFCGIESFRGWRHTEKSATEHVLWSKTTDGFFLGVRVTLDPYGPLFTWLVSRVDNPAHMATGGCGGAISGLTLAADALERWKQNLARAEKPLGFKPLPAAESVLPF